MEIKLIEVSDKRYKVINGTYYNENTPDAIIRILENSRVNRQRIRIFYGDTDTVRMDFETYKLWNKLAEFCYLLIK